MGYVGFDTVPIPETSFDDVEAVRARFLQVMQLELPAFVIRQAGTDITRTHKQLGSLVASDADLGGSRLHFTVPASSRAGESVPQDVGLHIDRHEAPSGKTQMTFYNMRAGLGRVTLFALQPEAAERVQTRRGGAPLEFNQEKYKFEHTVDSQLLIPRAHVLSELRPTDQLVFADSMNAHDFVTTEEIRRAIGRVYHVGEPRRQGGRRSWSQRQSNG